MIRSTRWLIEQVASSVVRCAYCDDCTHCTVECPGLRHDTPIAQAFKAKHFAPVTCSKCGEREWAGRPVLRMSPYDPALVCGDCYAQGTPLTAQPIREPERIKYHAGQTPTWDWVGDT